MTREITEFVIYMIHELANANEEAPSEIYKVLETLDVSVIIWCRSMTFCTP